MMKFLLFFFMLNFLFFMNSYLWIYLSMMLMISLFLMILINFNSEWFLIYSNFGLDWMSYILVILTLLIISFMILLSKNSSKFFYFVIFSLMICLLMSFMYMNMFMFYLFFEISLIPTFFLIFGWGHQFERVNASIYMLMYTLFFSLPFLILILFINEELNSLSFFFLNNLLMNMNNDWILILMIILLVGFLVKLPLFMFHIWLPKAHVQAPLIGSMILAGIMLKMGGYGMFRVLDLLVMNELMDIFMILSLFGMMFLSMLCIRQFDMKLIVAYSSVVHMGMMLIGIFSESLWGVKGGLIMMIGHGLCSSAMFMLVNLIYERSKSRSLLINKGMIYFLPSLMMFWFLFCMNNMAAPISLNLLSEIMIINILFDWSKIIMLLMMTSMFLSASYNLYLFSYSFHGIFNNLLMKIYSIKILDYYILLFHFIPLNLMILKLNFLI